MPATASLQHSIAKQLFKVVFAIYFFVTLMVTTNQMLTTYQTNKDQVINDLNLLYQTSQSSLVNALEESDKNALQGIFAEIVQHPSVLGIKIVTPNGQLIGGMGTVVNDKGQSVTVKAQNREVFEHKVMGMFAQNYAIAYQAGVDSPFQLGNLILYSNTKIVFLRVRAGFVLLLVGALIKTLALWLIFLVVSHFWLSRPLDQLIQTMKRMKPHHPQTVEMDLPTREQNELNTLEETINQMTHQWTKTHQTLVKELCPFSPLDEAERQSIHLTEELQAILHEIAPQFQEQVEFICDFQANPNMACWPASLNQAFMNIVVNACQAIELKQNQTESFSKGQLKITTALEENGLQICFEDNGIGMNQETQNKLFEPFYTTHTEQATAGLGMSIAYSVIAKHQGTLTVASTPNIGTTVTVSLPVSLG